MDIDDSEIIPIFPTFEVILKIEEIPPLEVGCSIDITLI